ncbi:hypothetical protein K450DRAFT_225729 [Umbelopsis ramanniana AG]|uniref:MSP domain-containing protein n=1 Tax=Umbelopsis ramanniana AG TaxID=1314678 RepID=A0AAD5EFN5_UMBRA|nr:uncharacterized protein K450DRAFT_225729 [Umbelopsis ramanniana AG]KAI8582981.1 hypothetical protein K450DRAFT_225729 [Umbelopsis ramanniana AG]
MQMVDTSSASAHAVPHFNKGSSRQRKSYASSVYSEKSANSAKSARSFLSMTTSLFYRKESHPAVIDSEPQKEGFLRTLRSLALKARKSKTEPKQDEKSTKNLHSTVQMPPDRRRSITKDHDTNNHDVLRRLLLAQHAPPQYQSKPSKRRSFRQQDSDDDEDEEDEEDEVEQLMINRNIQQPKVIAVPRIDDANKPTSIIRRSRSTSTHQDSSSTLFSISTDTNSTEDGDEVSYSKRRVTFVEPSPIPRMKRADQPRCLMVNIVNSGLGKADPKRLIFKQPLIRGATLPFELCNTSSDHLIVYKFLTLCSPRQERYFIRPSAGVIFDGKVKVVLFLNNAPQIAPGEVIRDKVLVRYAVVEKGGEAEQWIRNLDDSCRRRWLEMVREKFRGLIVREMKVKVRLVG